MPLLTNSKLLKKFNKQRNISKGALQDQHAFAGENHAFFAGDHMSYTASVDDKGRKSMVVFNKVKPYIDSVNGFMIQLRRKPQYNAVMADNAQQRAYSDYMNSLSDYFRRDGNFDHLESRQNKEMLITGYGAIDSNILYETNPDGEIRGEVIKYNEVFWDPQSREKNLLDSRWVYRAKKYNLQEALKRFKGSEPGDFDSPQDTDGSSFVYNPDGGVYDKISFGQGDPEEDLVEVYYYQYWDLETYYRTENPIFNMDDPQEAQILFQMLNNIKETRMDLSTPEVADDYFEFDPKQPFLTMTGGIKRDVDALLSSFGIDAEYQEHLKKVYYSAILSTRKVFMKFRSPDQQGFTIKFKTADFDEENRIWFGMVTALKEPAKYANKALTEILYVIAANSKGGIMYEESAVDDPARFEQQYAITKAAIKVNDGAISGNQIMPKAQAALPNGYEQVYGISNEALGEVTGINKEFLGTASAKQVSALMEAQRINQVVANLADYFDSISLYQKEEALLFMTYIRMLAENSTGRMVRIIGEQGASNFLELSEDKMAEEYDVEIGEAPTSATQKQETAMIMMQLADKVAMFGQNLYPFTVDYLPIKDSDKMKVKQALAPKPLTQEEQQIQKAKQMQQLEMQNVAIEGQKAVAAKNMADAQSKLADLSSIQFDNDRTAAEAENTRADTLRTLVETEQKDIENEAIKQLGIENVNLVI